MLQDIEDVKTLRFDQLNRIHVNILSDEAFCLRYTEAKAIATKVIFKKHMFEIDRRKFINIWYRNEEYVVDVKTGSMYNADGKCMSSDSLTIPPIVYVK